MHFMHLILTLGSEFQSCLIMYVICIADWTIINRKKERAYKNIEDLFQNYLLLRKWIPINRKNKSEGDGNLRMCRLDKNSCQSPSTKPRGGNIRKSGNWDKRKINTLKTWLKEHKKISKMLAGWKTTWKILCNSISWVIYNVNQELRKSIQQTLMINADTRTSEVQKEARGATEALKII